MRGNEEQVELVRSWVKLARESLLLAQSGLEQDYAPHHTVCWLCHASAERYLKAFLTGKGWKLRKTHDLEALLAFCVEFEPGLVDLRQACGLLNEYGIQGRYPGDLPFDSIGPEDAREATEAAVMIERLVLERMELSS